MLRRLRQPTQNVSGRIDEVDVDAAGVGRVLDREGEAKSPRRPHATAAAAGDRVLGGAVGPSDDRTVVVVDGEPASVVGPADRPDRARYRDVLGRAAVGGRDGVDLARGAWAAEFCARGDQGAVRGPGRKGIAMLATTAQVPKAVAIAADHVQVTASATDRGRRRTRRTHYRATMPAGQRKAARAIHHWQRPPLRQPPTRAQQKRVCARTKPMRAS